MSSTALFSSSLFWGITGATGLCLGFPNAFAHVPPMVLLYPLALTQIAFAAPGIGAAFRRGWLCAILAHILVLYWVAIPLQRVGQLHWVMAGVCALFVATILASSGAIFSAIAATLRKESPLRTALTLGLAWYLLEILYSFVAGFPWMSLPAAFAPWPIALQGAWIMGSDALSGSMAALAVLLFLSSRYPSARIAWPLLLCLLLLPGIIRFYLYLPPREAAAQDVTVIFVEGNVDQNEKWDPAFQRNSVDTYLRLTEEALEKYRNNSLQEQNPADITSSATVPSNNGEPSLPLVIWPETATPFHFQSHEEHTPRILSYIREKGFPLILGSPAYTKSEGNTEIFNRAYLLSEQGKLLSFYDKQYLVPFGEYLPTWLDFPVLRPLLQGVGIYSRGKSEMPLYWRDIAIGMLICYEAVFPELAQKRVANGANILLDISNDGWFGESFAPEQHLYLTVLRAIEQNRWLLRGTNTGISAVIDAQGRLHAPGGRNKAQALIAKAQTSSLKSPYHYVAPYLPYVATVLFFFLFLTRRRTITYSNR